MELAPGADRVFRHICIWCIESNTRVTMEPVSIRHSTSIPASFAVVVGVPPTILGRGWATVNPLHCRAHCSGVFPFPHISWAGFVHPGGGIGQSWMKWPSLLHRRQELGLGHETKLANSWFRVSCCRLTTFLLLLHLFRHNSLPRDEVCEDFMVSALTPLPHHTALHHLPL